MELNSKALLREVQGKDRFATEAFTHTAFRSIFNAEYQNHIRATERAQ